MGKKEERVFGKADEFYRARIITVEVPTFPDFEWGKDSLVYPSPPDLAGPATIEHRLDIVDVSSNHSITVSSHKTRIEAQSAKNHLDEDLHTLTKIEFDKKYGL